MPGDVVRLSAGDLVPADAGLLEARDLHVQEAALTGESLPSRSTGPGGRRGDRRAGGVAYLGTSVVSGTATARVVATGNATQFGDIAARLARARARDRVRARPAALRPAHHAHRLLPRALHRASSSLAHAPRPALESLLFAVALAVGLTPEFLPMITTVTLAQGAVRMAREKVIVKHLSAIQNLGSIDVLCSDKTGTLTPGEMALDRSLDAARPPRRRARCRSPR